MRAQIIARVSEKLIAKQANSTIVELTDKKDIAELLHILSLKQLGKIIKYININDLGDEAYSLEMNLDDNGGAVSLHGLPAYMELYPDSGSGFGITLPIPEDKQAIFKKYLADNYS